MTGFDDLALIYDQSIDWNQRLTRELPLLTKLLQNKHKARILDLACGSGRHAVALASQGYEVTGLDLSPLMIAAAKRHADEQGVSVRFLDADMRQAREILEGPFDLILCLGNSLALLPSISDVQSTLSDIFQLLRKGGSFVSQTLNFQEIRRSGFRFFPLKSGKTKDGAEVIFARFFEPHPTASSTRLVFVGLLQTKSDWQPKITSHKILQLDKPLIETALQGAGFQELDFFQDYEKHPFKSQESRNLIAIGTKKAR
jgi:2-polyprenyl-3-methyl-5-hydroxy-6-metoxy-1,4-benzoquinol methylase